MMSVALQNKLLKGPLNFPLLDLLSQDGMLLLEDINRNKASPTKYSQILKKQKESLVA